MNFIQWISLSWVIFVTSCILWGLIKAIINKEEKLPFVGSLIAWGLLVLLVFATYPNSISYLDTDY